MKKNRTLIYLLFSFLIISFFSMPVYTDNINPRVSSAIENGLNWLAKNQNENGSWTCRIGCKLNETYIGNEINDNIAVTALAGLSFMASGSTPTRGKYCKNVARALDFIIGCVRESDGYITKHGSRMYEHAFATLFLAEIYGMSHRDDVKAKLKKAVELIMQSQNKEGGWRYQPTPIDADISVTVTTLQALRAARNIGVSVPKETIDKAMKYIHNSATLNQRHDGSFAYQLTGDARTSPALTAAGVVALMSAGEYDSKEVENGLRYLSLHIPLPINNQYPYHYFYGHYYISQAMYQGGVKYWNQYSTILYRDVLSVQKSDGHWEDDVGPTYATAMATLILQVNSEYLPIFNK